MVSIIRVYMVGTVSQCKKDTESHPLGMMSRASGHGVCGGIVVPHPYKHRIPEGKATYHVWLWTERELKRDSRTRSPTR